MTISYICMIFSLLILLIAQGEEMNKLKFHL
ncbi:MAG: hypothetical protein ACMG6E_01705 [Candidatus Roizmanbacteria bacterium]